MKITDVAIEVMRETGANNIGHNEFGLLDEVWFRAFELGIVKEIGSRGGKRIPHPINRQFVVLSALDKDKRFRKFFIRCCDRTGRREVLVREFEIINAAEQSVQADLTIVCEKCNRMAKYPVCECGNPIPRPPNR